MFARTRRALRPLVLRVALACILVQFALPATGAAAPATPYVFFDTGSGTARELTRFDAADALVFVLDVPTAGSEELWLTDGTALGTVQLTTVSVSGYGNNLIEHLTPAGDALFFSTCESGTEVTSYKLWKTGGAPASTVFVKDIWPDATVFSPLKYLTAVDGMLFFGGRDSFTYNRPWRSDGTSAGTSRLGEQQLADVFDRHFGVAAGKAYFIIDNQAGGTLEERMRLAVSDGTSEGTQTVRDDLLLSTYSLYGATLGDYFYFAAYLPGAPWGYWRTDGTAGGTVLVHPTSVGSPAAVGGTLYFSAEAAPLDNELWRSDGEPGAAVLVKDINPTGSSNPTMFTAHDGLVYFVASTDAAGAELWRTDGTAEGTWLVKDIRPGKDPSNIRSLTSAGERLYFGANDGSRGLELWTSDGTPAGTQLVKDINPGSKSAMVNQLRVSGDRLYFTATDGVNGEDVWALDLPVTRRTYLPVLIR